MKFSIKTVRAGSRLGTLTEIGSHQDKTVETPTCLLYSRAGSVPHLSKSMLERIEQLPSVVNMPLTLLAEQCEILANYKLGIGKFSAMQDYISYCSMSDPGVKNPSGYNDRVSVGVFGKGGKLKVDVREFVKIQEALRPDWLQALCDSDTDLTTTRKRCRKAVDRSIQYLDECLEAQARSETLKKCCIFGTLEGGSHLEERLKSAKLTAERPVAGFILEGFHHHGPDQEHFQLDSITDLIKEIITVLPSDKPRLMPHCWTPVAVLQGVKWGIDIFDSVYPYLLTEKGSALVFNFNFKNSEDKDSNMLLHLKDKRYKDDERPVLHGCSCYTCQHHTRAYICHLLNTSELLAPVLLSIHNYHHYFGFFRAIREALATDVFDDLCAVVQESCAPHPEDNSGT